MGLGFMAILLVVLFVVRGGQSIFVKLAQDNRVLTLRQTFVFLLVYTAFQVLFFLILPPYRLQPVPSEFLLFPLCFALFFSASQIFLLLAINLGSTSMTNTIIQFSPIVPITYGLLFWGEWLSIPQIAGLALFLASIFLINRSDFSVKDIKQKSGVKWLVFSLFSALFAGISVIFTKQSMLEFPQYAKEYLVAFSITVTLLASVIVMFRARTGFKGLSKDKNFLLYVALAAFMLDINNYIFMMLIAKMQSAVFLTFVSGVSMISTTLLGRIVLKERLSRRAVTAVITCIISIILINIK